MKHLYLWGDPESGEETDINHITSYDLCEKLGKARGPVLLHINSFGGEDDHARAIIDAVEAHGKVTGIVWGRAESAAAWILQVCKTRVMMPRSSLMFHMGSSTKDAHSEWADKMFVDDVLRRINEKDSSYPRNKLVKHLKGDWHVYPTQALALGLIDRIGGVK